MNFYLQDILSQPQELEHFLRHYTEGKMDHIWDTVRNNSFRKILFSGMGSSHFCALTADIFLKKHGIESNVVSTGELLYYEKEIIKEDVMLCLISQSGESGEVVHILEGLSKDIFVVGITNNPNSTLARRSNLLLELFVSEEQSVTTRTYLSSYLVTMLLAYEMTGCDMDEKLTDIGQAIEEMKRYLENYERWKKELVSFGSHAAHLCLIGRGYALNTVRSGALFFREVVRFPALDFDAAEFRHGPMEMVEENFLGIVLAAAGPAQELNLHMAKEIVKHGGQVLLITEEETAFASDDRIHIISFPKVAEELSPLLQILPIQLLADSLAEEREIPVGVFRWGSKITKEK